MKRLLITVLAALALAPTASAGPVAPFAPALGVDVRHALNWMKLTTSTTPTKFVYVRCYTSDTAFDGALAWRFGYRDGANIWAYARKKEHTVYMRGWTCNSAKRAFSKIKNRNSHLTRSEVFGLTIALHEAIHVQGVKNENTTQCLATDGVRWVARGWGIPKSEANRLSRLAFDISARTTSEKYHSISGECQSRLYNKDWTDFA